MVTTILILIGAVVFCMLEGLKEWSAYQINYQAKFQPKAADVFVKWVNAFVFLLLSTFVLLYFERIYLFPALLPIRAVFLDGVLNTKRDLNFFSVGERDPIGRILKGWEVAGKILAIVVFGGASYLLYIYFFLTKQP